MTATLHSSSPANRYTNRHTNRHTNRNTLGPANRASGQNRCCTAGASPRAHRGHVEADRVNYGARRAVVAVVAVVAVMIVALFALAAASVVGAVFDVGGQRASASEVAPVGPDSSIVRIHVAQPGDTLWSIADRYRGEVGQGRFVDALIDLNSGTVIQVGQAVRLP